MSDAQSQLKPPPRILVVDHHDDIRHLIVILLQRHGYTVCETASPIEALDIMANGDADLAIVELTLPGISGADMLVIRATDPKLRRIPVIIIGPSPHFDDQTILKLGACAVVRKPFEPSHLRNLVESCLSRADDTDEHRT